MHRLQLAGQIRATAREPHKARLLFRSTRFSVPAAEPVASRLKELRLQRDDFEILKVIGRGAFSEVRGAGPAWLGRGGLPLLLLGASGTDFSQWGGCGGRSPALSAWHFLPLGDSLHGQFCLLSSRENHSSCPPPPVFCLPRWPW